MKTLLNNFKVRKDQRVGRRISDSDYPQNKRRSKAT